MVCEKTLRVQFNPNTLKVLYNPTTKKVLTIGCYDGRTPECNCFESEKTPLGLVAVVSGVRNCSDNNLSAVNGTWCLERQSPNADYPCIYAALNIVTIGEIQLNIRFNADLTPITGNGSAILINGTDPNHDKKWFNSEDTENTCIFSWTNDYAIEDCGNNCMGYGGTITITNPCE